MLGLSTSVVGTHWQPCAVADGSEGNARRIGIALAVFVGGNRDNRYFRKKEEDKISFFPRCGKWVVATVAGIGSFRP
jgi:hypothetical protein